MRRLAWVIAVAAAACTSAASQPAAPPAKAAPATAELLGSMAALAGVVAEPAELAAWAKKIDGGEGALAGYIDQIVGSERFAREIMPALLFGTFVNVRNYYALPAAFILKRAPSGALYLRAPCTAEEAVAVAPWWDLESKIEVCPDSYRPEKWSLAPDEHSYRTKMVLACDSQVGSPELETHSLCGCGPNLIRCLRDGEHYEAFNRSLMDEVKRTTAHIVQRDLPMATLFTGNSTFRDRNVELYYRRQRIGTLETKRVASELAELDGWPEEGKWAARAELRPGQHAGVLTAPQILHWLPDRRQRQRGYYEVMWCNLRNSFGATTQKVLELNANGNNFFVHDSWERLAHTDLCTNCHARLDYGSQFFNGYPDSRASTHYQPALQRAGTGPLYGQDIRDLRGTAPLTPAGFARLATEQGDFTSCMTNHFVSYVLGDRATPDDISAIESAVAQHKTFKAAMKMALVRYAERWREQPRTAAAPAAPIAGAPPGPSVTVSAPLRAALDQHCVDCHDEAPYTDHADSADLPFDFRGRELPRRLIVGMADQVAFGMMPKNQAIDPAVREALVMVFIDTLWADPEARAEAKRYYLGRARGLPAHQIDNALHAIDQLAHASSDLAWGPLERAIMSEQSTITPGFLAITGLEALRACARAVDAWSVTLEACLREAAAPSAWSRWPLPPAR